MEEEQTRKINIKKLNRKRKFKFDWSNRHSFVLVRDNESSIWEGFLFSIFLLLVIPHLGIPDKYDWYFYLLTLVVLVVFFLQIRKLHYDRIKKYQEEEDDDDK